MGFFYDQLKDQDPYFEINSVRMPEIQTPEQVSLNFITDGGRLADSIDYEGSVKGIKREVTITWEYLTKAHFDTLYNAIVNHYRNTTNMFIPIKFNSFSPDGIVTMTVYGGSKLIEYSVADTTERLVDSLGQDYAYGGSKYDILYKDVSIHFVER